MRRLSGSCCVASFAVSLVLACAGVASAATPLQEYQRTGRVTPCKYSSGQLGGNVPNDVAQYAPEYKAQLEAAARQRARGCGSSGGGGGSSSSSSSGGASSAGGGRGKPGPSRSVRPAPTRSRAPVAVAPPIDPNAGAGAETAQVPTATSSKDSGISAPVLVLLILGGLVLLGGALALVGRYLGWSTDRMAPAAHALREARMRIGTAAGGFVDWVRPAPRSS